MKIELTYPYQISVVPYRRKYADTNYSEARTEIEIEELDPSQAPVALLLGNRPQDAMLDDRFAQKANGSLRNIREVDGHLYVETCPVDELGGNSGEWLRRTTLSCGLSWLKNNPEENRTTITEMVDRARQRYGEEPREVIDDWGKQIARKLEDRATKMFICDGVLYEYTPEPVLLVQPSEGRVIIVARPLPEGHTRDIDLYDLYNPYRQGFHELFSLKNLGSARAITPELENVMPEVEILSDQALKFDAARYTVTEYLKELSLCADVNAKNMPWAHLGAFYTLRDAVHDSGGEVTAEVVEALRGIAGLDEETSPEDTHITGHQGRVRRHVDSFAAHLPEDMNIAQYYADGHASLFTTIAARALSVWKHRCDQMRWEPRTGTVSSISIASKYGEGRPIRTVELLSEGSVRDAALRIGADAEQILDGVRSGGAVIVAMREGYDPVFAKALCLLDQDKKISICLGEEEYQESFQCHVGYCAQAAAERDDFPEIPSQSIVGL